MVFIVCCFPACFDGRDLARIRNRPHPEPLRNIFRIRSPTKHPPACAPAYDPETRLERTARRSVSDRPGLAPKRTAAGFSPASRGTAPRRRTPSGPPAGFFSTDPARFSTAAPDAPDPPALSEPPASIERTPATPPKGPPAGPSGPRDSPPATRPNRPSAGLLRPLRRTGRTPETASAHARELLFYGKDKHFILKNK